MDFKDLLILAVIGLGFSSLFSLSKANFYEMQFQQLKTEIIRLQAEYEGFKESAIILND